MSQHNGMNWSEIYNLSPFSQSLWKNIVIFERNRIKTRRNDRYSIFIAAVCQVSLLLS